MDFKDMLQKNVANMKSKFPQISNMPKLPKLKTRKIFNTNRSSKDNVSNLQEVVPPATIVDRTPMKISTISSLVGDNTSKHYRSEQYLGTSSVSMNALPGNNNGENSQSVRFTEKLTRTYKELSEFKFSHIFGKKTIVRTTEIQLDMYKTSFDEEHRDFRKMSDQSQFDIEVVTLPPAKLRAPSPYYGETPQYSPNALIDRPNSPTFISYPAPQNNDEIVSVPTPPLTRRKLILPSQSEQKKNILWKNKKSKINKSTESEISSEIGSTKNSLRSTNESRKSSGMWKVQRAIRIKAPPENEKKPDRPSTSVKNMLKNISSKNSIDENKEQPFSQINLWQRSIKRKIASDKNESENEEVSHSKPIDQSIFKAKFNDILDKSSNKVKHLISKDPETITKPEQEAVTPEENLKKVKSMEEIQKLGYGKKNLRYIEKWKVRRRREIRRTKPFPKQISMDSETDTRHKKIRGMWNIQRPIRIKINLNENDPKSDSKTMQTQIKDFRNVVTRVWKKKIIQEPPVDLTTNEPDCNESISLQTTELCRNKQKQNNSDIIEEDPDDYIAPDLNFTIKNKITEPVHILSEKTSFTDSFKTTVDNDNINDESDTSFINQTWKISPMRTRTYSSTDSEHSITNFIDKSEYFTANRNEPTVIILNTPVQSVIYDISKVQENNNTISSKYSSASDSCLHLTVPVPLPLPTPPPSIKFVSPAKELSKTILIPSNNATEYLEEQIKSNCIDVSDLSKYIDHTCSLTSGHSRKLSINLSDEDCWTASNTFERRHSVAVLNVDNINEDKEMIKYNLNLIDNNPLRKWRSVDIFNDKEQATAFADFDDALKNVPIIGINNNINPYVMPVDLQAQDIDDFKSLEYLSLLNEIPVSKTETYYYEPQIILLNEIDKDNLKKISIKEDKICYLTKPQLPIDLERIEDSITEPIATDLSPPPLPLALPPPMPIEIFPQLDVSSIQISNIKEINTHERERRLFENDRSSISSTSSSVIMTPELRPEPTGIPVQKIKISKPVVKTESLRRQFSDECEAKNLKNLNVNKLITQFENTEINQASEKQSTINISSNISKLLEDDKNEIIPSILKSKLEKSPLKISNTNISKNINTNIKSGDPPPVNPRKKLQTKQNKKITNQEEEIFYSIDNYNDESQLYSLGGHNIIKELYTIDL